MKAFLPLTQTNFSWTNLQLSTVNTYVFESNILELTIGKPILKNWLTYIRLLVLIMICWSTCFNYNEHRENYLVCDKALIYICLLDVYSFCSWYVKYKEIQTKHWGSNMSIMLTNHQLIPYIDLSLKIRTDVKQTKEMMKITACKN